jgi:hypothetical protein
MKQQLDWKERFEDIHLGRQGELGDRKDDSLKRGEKQGPMSDQKRRLAGDMLDQWMKLADETQKSRSNAVPEDLHDLQGSNNGWR